MAVAVAVASCSQPNEPAPPAAFTAQPHANLAQVMRGIPFTFSNIVFDAQAEDPARRLQGGAVEEHGRDRRGQRDRCGGLLQLP